MSNKELVGLERAFIMQYLSKSSCNLYIESEDSEPYSCVVSAGKYSIDSSNIITIKDNVEYLSDLINAKVRLQFYFNRLGLFCITKFFRKDGFICCVVPDYLNKIEDCIDEDVDMYSVLYLLSAARKDTKVLCIPISGYTLFKQPLWEEISTENRIKAKKLLEKFVNSGENVGHGMQLIPICRYLIDGLSKKMEALEGRMKSLKILFLDETCVALGCTGHSLPVKKGVEYCIEMSFFISKTSNSLKREISAKCIAENEYKLKDSEANCVVCRFTSLQEEDKRFLFEKSKGCLFN